MSPVNPAFLLLCLLSFFLHPSFLIAREWQRPPEERKTWWNVQTDQKARVLRDELTIAIKNENWNTVDQIISLSLSRPEIWTSDPVRGVASSHQLAGEALKNLPAEQAKRVQSTLDIDAKSLLAGYRKNPDGEEETLRNVLKRYPHSPAAFDSANILLQISIDHSEPREVIELGKKIIAQNPENSTYRVIVARAYNELGETAAAKEILAPVLDKEIVMAGKKKKVSEVDVLAGGVAASPRTMTESNVWDKLAVILQKPQTEQLELSNKLAREITRPALEALKMQL